MGSFDALRYSGHLAAPGHTAVLGCVAHDRFQSKVGTKMKHWNFAFDRLIAQVAKQRTWSESSRGGSREGAK